MDPTALVSLISGGGPTALIVVLAVYVVGLRRDLRELQKDFHDFQIAQIANSATKGDLSNINATLGQIFDLLRDQQRMCGRDCAAMQQISRLHAE